MILSCLLFLRNDIMISVHQMRSRGRRRTDSIFVAKQVTEGREASFLRDCNSCFFFTISYLKTDFDFLGQSSFRENGLNCGNNIRVDNPSLRTNCMNFLPESCDDSEVMRELSCNDSSDSIRSKFRVCSRICQFRKIKIYREKT